MEVSRMRRIAAVFVNKRRDFTAIILALFLGTAFSVSQATAQDSLGFDIPGQELNTALLIFADRAGLQLVYDAGFVKGLRSKPLKGVYTREDGLTRLLEGTGIGFRFTGPDKVSLKRELVKKPSGPKVPVKVPAQPATPKKIKAQAENTVQAKTGDLTQAPLIVKAELMERDLQSTQTSVSIVTGIELDRSTDKDLFDTVDRLPNVSAQGGGFGFVIRGITDGGPGGAGQGQAISVQIDGANVPNGQSLRTGALSTWDLEQVEVLRGPQSTQQGPNSLAGAIILRSSDPIFEQEYKFRADYGSFNETRFAGTANLPLSDQFALRFSFEDYRSDGDIRSSFSGEDVGDEFLKTYRGKFRYQPSNALDVVLGYTRSENKLGSQLIIEDRFPEERLARQDTNIAGETDQVNLRISFDLNDRWSVQSETAYLYSDYRLENPLETGNPFNNPAFRTVDDTSINQELKLLYDTGTLRAVVGGYYLIHDKEIEFEAIVPNLSSFGFPPGTSAVLGNAFDNKIDNYAVFGEEEYDLTQQWMLVAGLRYDHEKQDFETTNRSVFTPEPFPGFNQPPTTTPLDADYSALLPKAGVVYSWTDEISTGFTVQRGYRAGGSAIDSLSTEPYEYDPEFTTNYELAFRSLWLNKRLRVNANLFYTSYEDIQVNIPGPSGTFVDATIQNAAEATLWGAELLSEFDVTPNLNLFANIGYTKTRFDEFILNIDDTPTDVSGNEFAQAPRWTGSAGAVYYIGHGFEAEFDVNFTDKSYYTPVNDAGELNSSFTLVNARIGYQSNSFWAAHLYARNLFDRQYLSRKRVDGSSTAGDSRVIGISITGTY